MSTSFNNSSGLQFSDLGLTTVVNGLSTTLTMFNSLTGQTTSTFFATSSLNYVIGSALGGGVVSILGSTYQSTTNNVLSLTTNSSRAVEIKLTPSDPTLLATVTTNGSGATSIFAAARIIRGPSTIIGQQSLAFAGLPGTDVSIPSSAFSFFDASPITGAATYLIQFQSAGISNLLSVQYSALFVRQI